MINRQVYFKDPSTWSLVNQGVAKVDEDTSPDSLKVLRYELETFVCDGQYEKGLDLMLHSYLNNIHRGAPEQPGVWVSGFFGSGKSHLVKILKSLWVDTDFPDGATARGIVRLPDSIRAHLKELSVQGKRHGGLHAASGTLGAGASGSVRLALLRIIFKSVGLPQQYPVARFVMWLKQEQILDQVRAIVVQEGHDWDEELDNFYVADGLHHALTRVKPNHFSSPAACVETLNNLFPYVEDISNDEMLKAITRALTREGKFPLTLIVLDEIQQFIGENSQRSMDVQEVVESCCKGIGGKLLFIGTGQTAVTGTRNLKKLEGRFTLRVELSDADVEAVIRKTVLAKDSNAIPAIEETIHNNLGEISRHLTGTGIGHMQDDVQDIPRDYPILPVRRRFWENTLRVLDQTGTDSQLRNQLSMVHKAIQTNLDHPLGNVIPADYLFFDSAERLLQARILPRKVHEKIMRWYNGSEDERLTARACGLIFLINKLNSGNQELGIKSNTDTLADLLVEDVPGGSGWLRKKIPSLLDECNLLMKVAQEYRIQTEESSAWNDEFQTQYHQLSNEVHRVEAEREDRIRSKFSEMAGKMSLIHGKSRVLRNIHPVFDPSLPTDCRQKICLWIRHGWETDENSVRAEAREAGNNSPTIFVFIPKRSADDLRRALLNYKAAAATLDKRGNPGTSEGIEARSAIDTIKHNSASRISELLDDAFAGARVFQAGGTEILGSDLQEMIMEAAENSLKRLYPQFDLADHPGWEKVYIQAAKGSPDALKAVGFEGDPSTNPVCKAILGCIAGGKKGSDIRNHFESPEYGWPRDAVDGGLLVLLVAGLIRAQDERGNPVVPKDLERKAIGKTFFKVESATVTTAQRIQIRKVFQKTEINPKPGEELSHVHKFLQKLNALAEKAGGEPPMPEPPDTSILEDIRLTSGNEQLLAIYNLRDELVKRIDAWDHSAQGVFQRMPHWRMLKSLARHASPVQDAEIILTQVKAVEQNRQLLEEPDMVEPLVSGLTQVLRQELNRLKEAWEEQWDKGESRLQNDANWQSLSPEQRHELRQEQGLVEAAVPSIKLDSTESILNTLETVGISALRDRIAAMPGRYSQLLVQAARLLEPEVQEVSLSSPILKTEQDVDEWLAQAREHLLQKLKNGPVIPD